MISDYDQRQYNLMLKHIYWFKEGRIWFGKLVDSLYALIWVLKQPNEKFRERFFAQWDVLELAYADMVNKKLSSIESKDKEHVEKALRELEHLIQNYMKEHGVEISLDN